MPLAKPSPRAPFLRLSSSTIMIQTLGTTAPPKEVRAPMSPFPLSYGCIHYRIAFLSWLRLATYMAIVAVAILISFHLKHQPTPLERKVALPFGILFWVLALACLASGLNNYIKTVNRYSRRQALVQTGIATQVVCARTGSIRLMVVANCTTRSSQSWRVRSLLRVFCCFQRTRQLLGDMFDAWNLHVRLYAFMSF